MARGRLQRRQVLLWIELLRKCLAPAGIPTKHPCPRALVQGRADFLRSQGHHTLLKHLGGRRCYGCPQRIRSQECLQQSGYRHVFWLGLGWVELRGRRQRRGVDDGLCRRRIVGGCHNHGVVLHPHARLEHRPAPQRTSPLGRRALRFEGLQPSVRELEVPRRKLLHWCGAERRVRCHVARQVGLGGARRQVERMQPEQRVVERQGVP
mmetsp:Transcript_22667/g.73336  ORF Transcript_22667/g.73336 Transcript_22667/m.73336 type:complete len:208 (-) Transcript_22667:693-1316(-)